MRIGVINLRSTYSYKEQRTQQFNNQISFGRGNSDVVQLAAKQITWDTFFRIGQSGALKFQKTEEAIKQASKSLDFFLKPVSSDGSLPIHLFSAEDTIALNKALKNKPKSLSEMYLADNDFGNLPIHNADVKKTKIINELFKRRPMVLVRMYLARNNRGQLPINCGPDACIERKAKAIMKVIKKLALNTKTVDDKTSFELLQAYSKYLDPESKKVYNNLKKQN